MVSKSITRSFPGFSSAYRLSDAGADRPFRADVEFQSTEEAVGATRAEVTLPGPVQARRAMGSKKPGDIIWTTFATPLLVSERVVTLLRDAGFTGWGTYDVELVGDDGAPIPGYYGLSIHGRCGPIDDSKSVEIPTVMPARIVSRWYGMYFEPDTWDGSDFFMPEGGVGSKFVVDDVRRAFNKAKIRNVKLTPLDEAELIRLP